MENMVTKGFSHHLTPFRELDSLPKAGRQSHYPP
ncbi:unnamed protein product, partial [marine sediment metagenome]